MLKSIRLIDFKSFMNEQVELAPLTLLVGANASGKSNFLDAIRFLQGRVFGLTLDEVLNGELRSHPDAWPGVRGRSGEAARIGTSAFRIDSVWLAPSLGPSSEPDTAELIPNQVEVQHHIVCQTAPVTVLKEEFLVGGPWEAQLKATTEGGPEDQLKVEQKSASPFRIEGTKGLLELENGRDRGLRPENRELLTWWSDALGDVLLLNINPAEMRDYGRRGYPLGGEGKNISGVLADLCESRSEKASLVQWLVELCAPEIEDIDFLEIKELGDVMAMLVEKGGKRISARSVSDGTLHFLGTLLTLRTAKPGSVILIEEIEAGLHPTRIRLLVEYLETVTHEREIQVIATTHSPVVLQWLSEESLRNAVVFGRIPEHEGTIMRRLGELPHFSEVLQRKGIDELFTTGWLEMAL
jgi:putative AbiEii toxin of type IV toxin-antitoxin system/AAA ATPase-like protein